MASEFWDILAIDQLKGCSKKLRSKSEVANSKIYHRQLPQVQLKGLMRVTTFSHFLLQVRPER